MRNEINKWVFLNKIRNTDIYNIILIFLCLDFLNSEHFLPPERPFLDPNFGYHLCLYHLWPSSLICYSLWCPLRLFLMRFFLIAGADVPTSKWEGSNKDEGGDTGTKTLDLDKLDWVLPLNLQTISLVCFHFKRKILTISWNALKICGKCFQNSAFFLKSFSRLQRFLAPILEVGTIWIDLTLTISVLWETMCWKVVKLRKKEALNFQSFSNIILLDPDNFFEGQLPLYDTNS